MSKTRRSAPLLHGAVISGLAGIIHLLILYSPAEVIRLMRVAQRCTLPVMEMPLQSQQPGLSMEANRTTQYPLGANT